MAFKPKMKSMNPSSNFGNIPKTIKTPGLGKLKPLREIMKAKPRLPTVKRNVR